MMHGGVPDQGITSPTHRSHLGGMVFSGAVINQGAENPSAFVDHCVLGQPCYGRFYLPKSLSKLAGSSYASMFALRATVDGTPYPEGTFSMINTWTTYNFTLFRGPSDGEAWEHPKWFLEKVASRLPPGEHTLELAVLVVKPGTTEATGKPIATGRIGLTVPPNSRQIVARALRNENRILADARAAEAQQEQSQTASEPESSPSESPASDESSSSSSSEEQTAAAPAAPSCLPDGALTDDWNKCCGRHYRGTAGDFHCCSQVGGGTDVKTACY